MLFNAYANTCGVYTGGIFVCLSMWMTFYISDIQIPAVDTLKINDWPSVAFLIKLLV